MRIGYIDNLRAILMMLGVVLHSAAVFSTQKYWLVSYEQSSIYLDWLIAAIHAFRMPLFFIIAGFFAKMLLGRYGLVKFLQNRTLRIGAPLITSALLLNTLQNYVLTLYYQQAGSDVNFYAAQAISHLWFLVNLIFYCIFLAVFAVVTKSNLSIPAFVYGKIGFYCSIVIFPFVSISILAIGTSGVPIYGRIPLIGMPYMFLYYFSFFAFGVLLYTMRPWVVYIESSLLKLATVCVCVAIAIVMKPDVQSHWGEVLSEYLNVSGVMLVSLFIWSTFAKLVSRPRAWLSYLSGASYTMYLVHQLLIVLVVMAVNLAHVVVPPFLLFGGIVALVFILSLLIHSLLIDRFAALKLAFNGR